MTDWDAWLATAIIAVTFIAVWAIRRWRCRVQNDEMVSDPTMDFGQPIIRLRLQRMIEAYGLTGSCNIRDGRVLPCPNQEGVSDLSKLLMTGYALGLPANGNVNLMLCVLRDGCWVPTNVTLEDLRTASIALEN